MWIDSEDSFPGVDFLTRKVNIGRSAACFDTLGDGVLFLSENTEDSMPGVGISK